ncbi:outer membrane lipoprotein-sorting protein [Alkalicoccus daliensis]|uniref:outer membrane lipoprotein-sorting protein n=1 Tax=Alkalicoccus daliensis TaxID=745820 RepID=UPI0011130B31|nr:outer membrane lipoprotein-sorting protein [Alkalicoccus daliensis]
MKKRYILSFTSVMVLAGCGDNTAEENETNDNGNDEINEEAENNAQLEEEEAAAILEEALAEFDEIESVYRERPIDSDGDDPDITGEEKEWVFVEDGDVLVHREREFPEEELRTYMFTDREDPEYAIFYEEGSQEAIRYQIPETPTGAEEVAWFQQQQELFEAILEDGEAELLRDEELNGFDTYVLETFYQDVSYRWFDQETHFQVRAEVDVDLEGPGIVESNIEERELTEEVYTYEINPTFDESLFELPEDMELAEGSYEDIPEERVEEF